MCFNKGVISELEASKLEHLATIGDLTKELSMAKQRITQLEQLNRSLESSQQLHSDEQTRKFQSLQQVIIIFIH
jgi:hypothetical protein